MALVDDDLADHQPQEFLPASLVQVVKPSGHPQGERHRSVFGLRVRGESADFALDLGRPRAQPLAFLFQGAHPRLHQVIGDQALAVALHEAIHFRRHLVQPAPGRAEFRLPRLARRRPLIASAREFGTKVVWVAEQTGDRRPDLFFEGLGMCPHGLRAGGGTIDPADGARSAALVEARLRRVLDMILEHTGHVAATGAAYDEPA